MDWVGAAGRLEAAIYAPLRGSISRLPVDRWPSHDDLNSLATGVFTSQGKPVRFIPPRDSTARDRTHYEAHIAATGEVETRADNWHDLFNALAWITYPQAKARINAQHAAILEEGGDAEARNRGPERDALTLFDEGGVIVASRAPDLMRLIVDFEWKPLFWDRREELAGAMRFFAFGHALYEQALEPYIGMVAKTVFVPVDELFFMLPIESQVAKADELVASHFSNRAKFHSPKSMAPMPVLGVPGWHFAAQDEEFYDDPKHFRSKGGKAGPAA
jgi:hypothetical protein